MIDRIYYINLDRRPDRNENIIRLMNKYNLHAIRVSAFDGSKLDINKISNNIITSKGIADAKNSKQKVYVPLTSGAIGCALSHRSIWEKIANENIRNALILEDDIRINENLYDKLEVYKKYFPKDYDIIYLGYHDVSIKHNKGSYNDIFYKSGSVYGLFGYIVSKKGAKKLLNIFPISYQIDTVMSMYSPYMNTYMLKENYRLIYSDPSQDSKEFGTDIQFRKYEPYNNVNSKISNCNLNNIFLITIILLLVLYLLINDK